jgi:AraC family transcriptional regulator
MPHSFSAESRRCLDALPATSPIACSTDAGWTSLLVRQSRCTGSPDPYDTLPTVDHKLVIVTRGEVDVSLSKKGLWQRATYRPGTAGLSVPGEVDRLRLQLRKGNDAFEKLHLFLPHALVDEVADHVRRPGQAAPRPPLGSMTLTDHAVAQIAGTLTWAMRTHAPDYVAEVAGQWLALQLITRREAVSPHAELRHPGPITDARLRRALDYMSANLDQPLTLEAIAGEANVSKFHFTRLFRARVGITPMQYLSELRLAAASRMLATTDLPIARVAFECGHRNVTHFSDVFRRRFGCSPSHYRQSR